MPFNPSILNRLCIQRGFSHVKLARDAGISRMQLLRILRGVNSPTYDTLEALARALGKQVRDLVR